MDIQDEGGLPRSQSVALSKRTSLKYYSWRVAGIEFPKNYFNLLKLVCQLLK